MTTIKLKQLRLLLNDFELMSKTVFTQLQIVSKLLEDNTVEPLYEEAEANEIMLDRLEVKIREEVLFSIFKFNPLAADLRKIISHQDVTANLERIGDLLLNIIHFLKRVNITASDFRKEKKIIDTMHVSVSEMVRNAVFSFSNEDSIIAYEVIKEDDKIDELFHLTEKSLPESFSGKQMNKEDILNLITINAIAYNLERIGDSATNIAEATVFLIEGKDIRHANR